MITPKTKENLVAAAKPEYQADNLRAAYRAADVTGEDVRDVCAVLVVAMLAEMCEILKDIALSLDDIHAGLEAIARK